MTYMLIGILLGISGFFFIGVKGLLLPILNKKAPETSVLTFSWIVSGLFLLSLLLANISFFVGTKIMIPPYLQTILLLSGGALLSMPFLFQKSLKIQLPILFLFCFIGTVLIPLNDSIWTSEIGQWSFRFIGAGSWMLFLLMNTTLDRIPLFTYITNTALFIILAISATTFIPLLSPVFFYLFFMLMVLNMITFYIFQKNNILIYTFPLSFLLNWIVGFVLLLIAASGKIAYIPIIFGYNMMEIMIAIGINVYLYRRLFPIMVPFIVEKAFADNLPIKKIIKKVFYTSLLLGFLGIFGIYSDKALVFPTYVLAFIVLINAYMSFSNSLEKPTIRGLFKDITAGVKTLSVEMKKLPLKQEQNKRPSHINEQKEILQTKDISVPKADKKQKKVTVTVKNKKNTKNKSHP
ncbi:MAG: hypothetical protein IJC11_01160 [Alphaproteobacteria bacterium]|nr:hypothetical protein [Alphaproteobacteria bacterium]